MRQTTANHLCCNVVYSVVYINRIGFNLCHAIFTVLSDLLTGYFFPRFQDMSCTFNVIHVVPLIISFIKSVDRQPQSPLALPMAELSDFVIMQTVIVRGCWIRLTGERPFVRSLVLRDLQVPTVLSQLPEAGLISVSSPYERPDNSPRQLFSPEIGSACGRGCGLPGVGSGAPPIVHRVVLFAVVCIRFCDKMPPEPVC